MIDIPAEVIATWPEPNTVNPKTHGQSVVAVNGVLVFLCFLAVGLRLYVRITLTNWYGLDDTLIVIALMQLFTLAVGIGTNIGNIHYGWNRHIWDIPLSWISGSVKIGWITDIFYIISSNTTALSFLVFYERLNKDARVYWFRWANRLCIMFVLTTAILWFFLNLFQCWPISAYWEYPPQPGFRCLNEAAIQFGGSIVKTFVDFCVTTLPIPLIMRLNIPIIQKKEIAVLLGCGYFITVVGIFRTYYTWKVSYTTYDTWLMYPMYMAGGIESHIAVVIACIPPSRLVLERWLYGIRRQLAGFLRRNGSIGESFKDLVGIDENVEKEGVVIETRGDKPVDLSWP